MGKHYKPFEYSALPDSSRFEIDNRPLEALGEVVMKFEALDAQVSSAIGFLLRRGDRVALTVTSPMSFQVKLKVFRGLVTTEYPDADVEKLRELCQICSMAEEKRNLAVHSRWEWAEDDHSLSRRKTSVG